MKGDSTGMRHFGHNLARQSVFTHQTVDFMSHMSALRDDLVRKDEFVRKERAGRATGTMASRSTPGRKWLCMRARRRIRA
jgi:hypothetical protein